MRYYRLLLLLLLLLAARLVSQAGDSIAVEYYGGVSVNAGGGDFAPYHIMSLRRGLLTQPRSAILQAGISHRMDTTRRASWGAAVEVAAGVTSATTYHRWNEGQWEVNRQRPASVMLQQAFVEGKWRGVTASLGMKDLHGHLVDRNLSSGDLVMSGNARAPIGFRAGFVNYQNVPFTKGWLRIRGEGGFYHLGDSKWIENHHNMYNSFLTTDFWFNYKNIYFSTPSDKRVVGTIGAQASCMFGGTRRTFQQGVETERVTMSSGLKAFFKSIIPGHGDSSTGDVYVEGSHLGSWDLSLAVKVTPRHTLRAYAQWLWEDGSGIGKLNGWDGLWGVEYKRRDAGLVEGAVLELISFTNQSGPIHFNPDDYKECTTMTSRATGADDYYNNYFFNGYMSHGMAIGSPVMRSPIYNTDGYMRFTDNWLRGFHCAVTGTLCSQLRYCSKATWRESWGTTLAPRKTKVSSTSWLAQLDYLPKWKRGLTISLQVAGDHGTLLGNNTGALLAIQYNGNFSIRRR